MRVPLIAALLMLAAMPTAAESPTDTRLSYQQRTSAACPALWVRTKASEGYDETAYSETECGCLAEKITAQTWNDADSDWTGPMMPESDAAIIANAAETEETLDDVLFAMTEDMSEAGFDLAANCYFKDGEEGGDAVADNANTNAGGNASNPHAAAPVNAAPHKPAWIMPPALADYQAEARPLCSALDNASLTPETQGSFTCSCAVGQMTAQAWDDNTYDYSGPFMTEADGKLILDSLKASANMSQASQRIYGGLSSNGQSVMSACFSK
ncbi:MAG: hypothetical protein KDA53_18330 [Hyphomonas sp.]|nr:hypothetical protein [Hyphomonas sp.]